MKSKIIKARKAELKRRRREYWFRRHFWPHVHIFLIGSALGLIVIQQI